MQYRNPPGGCQPRCAVWVDRLLDALLPMVCLLCGGQASAANVCRACLAGLPVNAGACAQCGLPRSGLRDGVCGRCLLQPPPWDRLYAPLRYEFPVDVLVKMLKFQRKLAAGRTLALAMQQLAHQPVSAAGEVLVPVPLHWIRLMRRGYNQASELCLHLARDSRLPIIDRQLCRQRHTRSQAGLDANRRRRNLRDAFRWRGPALNGTRVILVDDVMTTGSTARECTRILLRAGAGSVEVWVAARALQAP